MTVRLRGQVGLAAALATAACAVPAPPAADAGLIAALSTSPGQLGQLDVFMIDPLSSSSVVQVPAGVNTAFSLEQGVSLTADGGRLGFTSDQQTFLVDRSTGQRAAIPPETHTVSSNIRSRNGGAVSPDGSKFVTGSEVEGIRSVAWVYDVSDLAAVRFGGSSNLTVVGEGNTFASDPVIADNGRMAWIFNRANVPTRIDEGDIAFTAGGSTVQRLLTRPHGSVLASEPTIKPLPKNVVSFEDTAITFTSKPGRFSDRVDLGVVVMDGDPDYELLSLPGVSLAGQEMLPAWSGDGRYLAFVAVSAETPPTPSGLTLRDGTLKVYDTLTQAFVNPEGRTVGTKRRFDSLALARTPPVILGFAGANTTISPAQSSTTLMANLSLASNVGILVQRIVGTRRLFGRRVPRLRTIGRVPLGRHARGRDRIPWSLRVNGRRLAPGRYQITLRALRGSRVTDLSKPVTVRVR
jgi:hypothetical protein